MNSEQGIGIILDENSQDIPFRLETVSDHMEIGAKVFFEIELTAQGLFAVEVELAIKRRPAQCIG